jgi:hypothetical protein
MAPKHFIIIQSFLNHPETPWIFSALIHLMAAFFSFGYHHPDEHYQILEFARHYIHANTFGAGELVPLQSNLPWEFSAQIRPWLQPFLHVIGIKFAHLFQDPKDFDPFLHAWVYRSLYGIANVIVIRYFWNAIQKTVRPITSSAIIKIGPWILATLWFFPYIHVRTSSENLSGIFLTFTFAYWLLNKKTSNLKSDLFTGMGLGLAFLARYQIALGLIGFALYLIIQDRGFRLRQFRIFVGFIIMIGLGVILDRVGYGQWVITSYRYFHTNLIQGVAALYNPYPFYQYFIWIIELNPLVSIPLSWGLYRYLKKNTSNEVILFCGVFFLIHLLMTNKEYRFIFPILNLIVPFCILGWSWDAKFFNLESIRNKLTWSIINLSFLMGSSGRIASYALWPAFALHSFPDRNYSWISNHADFVGHFYETHEPVNIKTFSDLPDFTSISELQTSDYWVLWDERSSSVDSDGIIQKLNLQCELKKSSLPVILYTLRKSLPALKRIPFQAVYFCPNRSSN